MLIIFFGTIITFFGALPSVHFCASSCAKAAFSISATDMFAGSSILKRIFPLNETGYSKVSSTIRLSSTVGQGS